MFLEWIAELGFLKPEEGSGLLNEFSVSARALISNNFTEFLLKETTPISTLSTNAHITLVMECVGQAFNLPMEHANVIKSATELYRRWLLEKNRPPPLEVDEQVVFKRIFRHFSLLFVPRTEKETQNYGDVHYELCSTVLEIIQTVGQKVGSRMTVDTWEELLKIMLGITDSLLKGGRGNLDQAFSLGQILCPLLLRILCELWLRSGTENPQLWKHFRDLWENWRHRMYTIQQWSIVCLGLTNRVIRILYGPEEGSDAIIIPIEKINARIFLDDNYTLYAWCRFLNIIGDLETLVGSQNYYEAINGVKSMVNLLLSIKKNYNNPKAPNPPRGNTILQLFGSWLFRAVIIKKKETFDKGVAVAIETLCSVFQARKDFSINYLACFYRGIEETLQRNNFLIGTVIIHCQALFQHELPGCRLLLPAFVKAISTVLSCGVDKPLFGVQSMTGLRAASIKLLSFLPCLANQFGKLKFPITKEEKERGLLGSYSELNLILDGEILLDCLRSETVPANIQNILWIIYVHIFENISAESNFINLVVNYLLHQIMTPLSWEQSALLTALQVLIEISHISSFLKSERRKELAKLIVSTLCKYIQFERNTASSKTGGSQELIVAVFECISSWSMIDQWVLKEKEILMNVFTVIAIGLWGGIQKSKERVEDSSDTSKSFFSLELSASSSPSQYFPTTPQIKEVAQCTLNNLVNFAGNSMSPPYASVLTCTQTEEQFLSSLNIKPRNVSCYIFDKSVITLIPNNARTGDRKGPSVIFIVRDMSGKYVWTMTGKLPLPSRFENQVYSGQSNNIFLMNAEKWKLSMDSPSPNEEDKKLLYQLLNSLQSIERRQYELLEQKYWERLRSEAKLLQEKNYRLNYDIYLKSPKLLSMDDSIQTISSSRLFLAQHGFLSLTNRNRFHVLQPSNASQPFDFLQNFKNLDQIRERECYSASIIYVSKGQLIDYHGDQILDNATASADFLHFMHSIGWMTRIEGHQGFKGSLDPKITGEMAPYFANIDCELIFYVSTLMAAVKNTSREVRKKIITENKLLISWMEEWAEHDTIRSHRVGMDESCFMHIMIIPLECKLYRIRIYRRKSLVWIGTIGPLIDEIVVGKQILPNVVRWAVISSCKLFRDDKRKPHLKRKELIEELTVNYQSLSSPSQFYGAQFI